MSTGEQTFYITDYCTIEAGQVIKNGELLFAMPDDNTNNLPNFLKHIYKEKAIDYPKFFKMDHLSKLAFIGSELLLNTRPEDQPVRDIAIVLSNSTSSLDTDKRHSESIQHEDSFYPSPAVFVYTLANICLAEISIRHRLQGENAFFIAPAYDDVMMLNYTRYLLQTNRAKKVLSGWIDYLNGEYKLVLYLVEKKGKMPHTIDNIKNLF